MPVAINIFNILVTLIKIIYRQDNKKQERFSGNSRMATINSDQKLY